MIFLILMLGTLLTYFVIGYRVAIWNIPRVSEKIEQRWSAEKYLKNYALKQQQKARKKEFYLTWYFWLFRLAPALVVGKISQNIDDVINTHDPVLTRQKIEQLESVESWNCEFQTGLSEKRLNLWKDLYPRAWTKGSLSNGRYLDDETYVKSIISIWYPEAKFLD